MLRGHTFFGDFSQGSSMTIRAGKRLRISAYLSASFLLIFAGLAAFPISGNILNTSAAEKNQQSTTLSMTSSNFYANPRVTSTSGTFSSTTTDISVLTNNYTGYTISVAAKADTEDYSKLKGAGYEYESITEATTEEQFSSVDGTQYNGFWGYKPSVLNKNVNNVFLPAPTFAGDLLNSTDGPNNEADTYSIALGARADLSVPYGRYTNAFVVRTVANPIGYSITYDKNTTDEVNNMPENSAGSISDESFIIPDNIPERSGYDFVKWCEGDTRTVRNIDYCDGVSYESGDEYFFDKTGTTVGVELKAIWKPVGAADYLCNRDAETIGEAVCMQDMNSKVKESMVNEKQYVLIDERDDKKYFVSKLGDGNVWMTQNLDFILDKNVALTHDTSDLGWTHYDENATWTPSSSTITEGGWDEQHYESVSMKTQNVYFYPSGTNAMDKKYASVEDCAKVNGDAAACAHYNNGVIYNWSAAIAVNDGNTEHLVTDYNVAPDSVCPAGWRLPKGASGENDTEAEASEYGKLYHQYGIIDGWNVNYSGVSSSRLAQLEAAPLYFTRAGDVTSNDSAIMYTGELGYYNTATSRSGMFTGRIYLSQSEYGENNGYLQLNKNDYKYYGASVRCVARDHVTVTFDPNGGVGERFDENFYDGKNLPLNTFTKEGQGFVEWNTEADGTGDSYEDGDFFQVTSDTLSITLYAQWGTKTTLIYDGNGADSGSVESVLVEYKKKATLADNGFIREGYKFYSWNTQADGNGKDYNPGDDYTAMNKEGGEVRLYVKWEAEQTYTVNYRSDDGVNTVEYVCYQKRQIVSKISRTQNIDATGKKISDYGGSWKNNNIVGADRESGGYSTAHVVTIPGASEVTVEVYFNGENTSYDWVSIWSGSYPSYTAQSNYNASNIIASKLGGRQTGTYILNGNLLSAMGYEKYTVPGDTVTFSFKSDGSGAGQGYGYYAIVSGFSAKTACERKSGDYITPNDRENAGFIGWNTSSSAYQPIIYNEDDVMNRFITYPTTYTLNLYAVYGPHTTYVFDANGGEGTMESQKIPYFTSANLSVNTYTREGYGFAGWNTKADGTGTFIADGQEVKATNRYGTTITLYAQWNEKKEYTVNYHNGDQTNTVKYKCWENQTMPKSVNHTANISDDGTMNYEFSGTSGDRSTITIPNATKIHIKLTYGSNSISYGWVSLWAGETSNYAYQGYSTGLKLNGNTTGKYGGNNNGEPFVLEADIPGDTISISHYYSSYGTGYGYYLEVSRAEDAMLCELEPSEGTFVNPTAGENDVLLGWDLDENALAASFADEAAVKAHLKKDNETNDVFDVYAIWGRPTTLHFDANGGEGHIDDILIKNGESAILPNYDFTYEPNELRNWNTAADNSGTSYYKANTYNATDPRGGTVTLYAIWGKQTRVHFDANGGEGTMEPLIIPYSRTINMPNCLYTKEGSIFLKWNEQPDGSGRSYNTYNSIYAGNLEGEDITLYAIWGSDVTFYFHANGGEGEMAPYTVKYNSNTKLPTNQFTRTGYVFAYWNTKADESGTRYYDNASYYADITNGENEIHLYAIWGNPTTIVYDGNGATSGSMESHTERFGETIQLHKNTYENNGKSFIGWNTASDGTGISYVDEQSYYVGRSEGGEYRLYAVWSSRPLPSDHNSDNEDPEEEPNPDPAPGNGRITLARAYEISYVAKGKGMYVPHKDPETGEYDGTYFEATDASDYEGIPARDLRFAMQDMTPELCKSVNVYDEKYDKVIDLRDFKSYFISKRIDGKCWMTQNLDLDLESTPNKVTVLTSENTDLNYYNPTENSNYYHNEYSYDSSTGVITWTPSSSTINFTGTSVLGWSNDQFNTHAQSANPGDVIFYNYLHYEPNPSMPSITFEEIGRKKYNSLQECVADGNYRNRCKHYHAGNYYNWAAAVAVSNSYSPETYFDLNAYSEAHPNMTEDDYPEMPNSICPKGWSLLDGRSNLTTLMVGDADQGGYDERYYNESNKPTGYDSLWRAWGLEAFFNPMFYTRAGRIHEGVQDVYFNERQDLTIDGAFWTNRIFNNTSTYNSSHTWFIRFGSNERPDMVGGDPWVVGDGYSVRCVAR